MSNVNENTGFLGPKTTQKDSVGCCRSKHTYNCCIATGVFGGLFIVIGIVALLLGQGYLEAKILKSMALIDGSERYESWLRPPVQPHLYGYAFHVKNPEAVLRGGKPILEERGPYVYKSTTIKDSDDNVVFDDEKGTLTYRPRRVYSFEPSLTGPGLDPFKDFITVPNIPFWTALHGQRSGSATQKGYVRDLVSTNGLKKPFITVTFDQLLWGYNDELPCLKLDLPKECGGMGDSFGSSDDDEMFDMDWKRKKRAIVEEDAEPSSEWYGLAKPKAEFVNCSCQWGLFRDRNVTLRKPLQTYTGVTDLNLKGVVVEYDNSDKLNWWEPDSVCDKVKGQDSSTLPPNLNKDHVLDIYIALMCRSIKLQYEKDVEHAGIKSLRFIPPPNALGHYADENVTRRNEDNKCYCPEGFTCFKSGVYNMEPCKRDAKAPLALSMPHFYQADESYLNAVSGLKPEKEKHQFFMDVVPEFGFPLAIRPRFQLNIVIGRNTDPDFDMINGMQDEIVFPFLWAQDGFDEPSEVMADKIKFGLDAPKKLPMMGGVVCFVIGGILLLTCLAYFIWNRRGRSTKNINNTDVIHS